MEEKKQGTLFDIPEWWEEHWQDMPEFNQRDLTPFNEVIVKFRNRQDMEEFMKIVSQKMTMKTNSIWFPKLELSEISNKRYADES